MKNIARDLAFALLSLTACRTTNVVSVDNGPLVGTSSAGVHIFFGVPYAAPPIGELRFRPPQEMPAWDTPRDATKKTPPCAQPDSKARAASSEDCLTLNVWTPGNSGTPRPVLVWIHGGAFFQGSGSDALYDGTRFAARTGAVLVTINYRLGPLGFMAHPAFAREAGREVAPSYGLLDQRAALAWVKRNIAAFGGDPKNVTIFGESAGGWSVCVHLASPNSRGLFDRAIIQSGACEDALYFDPPRAHAQGEALARQVGCNGDAPLEDRARGTTSLECLRQKDAQLISNALPMKRGLVLPPGVWWGPVVDGVEGFPVRPMEAIRSGDFAKVPLMIGANRDEGILHTVSFEHVTLEEVEHFVRDSFGDPAVKAITEKYSRPVLKDSLTDIITDGIFVCEARRVARVVAAQNVPVYLYHFTRALEDPRVHGLGATHSVDLFFLFGNHDMGYGIFDSERPLSDTMMDAWGRFAAVGDPSGAELEWPRYSAERDEHLELDLLSKPGARLKSEICDFWDQRR